MTSSPLGPGSILRTFALAFVIAFILRVPTAHAQFPSPVNNDTRTPVPGSGHDYIKMLTETVDPSSGSLSVHISTPVPPSRGITIPFSFDYSSGAVKQAQVFGTTSGVTSAGWAVPTIVGGVALTSLGWSYRIPELTANQKQVTCQQQPSNETLTTDVWADYIFTDPSGSRHNLNVAHTAPLNGDCVYAQNPVSVSSGGDDFYSASLNQTTGAVAVVGVDGTVYNFPVTSFGGGFGVNAWLPSTIEDRNGNIVTISQGSGGSITETDTAGRPAVSTSAPVGQNGTVSISGLSNGYIVTWETISALYGSKYEQLADGYNDGCYWEGDGNGDGSLSVIKSIELPNLTYYTFEYNSYGLLKQISYPTGAVVTYTWNIPSSPTGLIEFPPPSMPGNQDACAFAYYAPMITQRTVSFDGVHTALVQNFSYTTAYNTGVSQAIVQTTVYSSNGSTNLGTFKTVYNYYPFFPTDLSSPDEQVTVASAIPVEQTVDYYDYGQTKLLDAVTKGWQDEHLLGCQLETHDGSGLRGTFYSYGSGASITDEKEYDYGQITGTSQCPQAAEGGPITAPAGPTRETAATYQVFPNTPIFPAGPSILDRPCSIVTKDSHGNKAAETDYLYDGGTSICGTAGTPSVASANTPIKHDSAYAYTASPQPPRGNATSVTRQCIQSAPACSSGNPTTTYTYDETGQAPSMRDPNGNATQYSYADSYTSGTPPGNTNAYLTKVTQPTTNGVAHVESYSYSYSDGQLTKSTDQNNQPTTYTYNTPPSGCSYPDGLDRLGTATYPDGGKTSYCYNDSPPSPSVTTSQLMNTSNQWITTVATADGLGHVVTTTRSPDPDCSAGLDATTESYDGLGRPYTISNPYCTAGDSTYGITTYTYDALGRTCVVAPPTGTPQSSCPSTAVAGDVATVYTGRATAAFDEGNGTQSVERVSQTDALGRLSSICEVASAPFVGTGGASSSSLIGQSGSPGTCPQDIAANGFLTTYSYDVLGNLQGVTQGTMASRSFVYDSLSRLTSSTNPESNMQSVSPYTLVPTTYTYDANGNLSTKAAPLPNYTGTSLVTTSYQYDALNRLTHKSFNDGITPTASFAYDSSSHSTNTVGRLVETYVPFPPTGTPTAQMTTVSSYDPMGRISQQWQYTPTGGPNDYSLPYAYDLMGNMTSSEDPYQNVFTYKYNPAARLLSVTGSYSDSDDPANLLSAMHYNAAGQLTSDALGDGEVETYTYDKRLRSQALSSVLNSTAIYSYSLAFAPNGDVTAANDSVNGNWNYSYDQFNRLICASLSSNTACAFPPTGTPTFNYVYDRFGNRWQQNSPTGSIYTSSFTFTGNSTTNNNRMDTYSYDSAGNLLYDNAHHYFYDAENHLIQVDGTLPYCTSNGTSGSAATACYYYDASGHRVHRTGYTNDTCDTTGKRDYVFDLAGHAIVENNSNGTACDIQVYVGDRHFGRQGGGTFFYHSDWLGTVRIIDSDYDPTYGSEVCTSLPFGDGLTCNSNHANVYHFTGKERDYESNLDNFGARYNASSMGRFTSPDPLGGHQEDPQTMNRYAYVRNNPLNLTDPTGLDFYLQCQTSDHSGCTQVQIDPNNKNGTYWVQAGKDGNATVVTSDEIRVGAASATFSENGVVINGKGEGIYFDNPAGQTKDASGNVVDDSNPITLAGSGALKNLSFTVNGNCSGTCLSSGEWTFDANSYAGIGGLFAQRGAFTKLGEDAVALLGEGAHPRTSQFRFGGPLNSPHLSVPYDYPGTVPYDPTTTVPRTGNFHVDEHSDWRHDIDVVVKQPWWPF
ncbi:MAG TPA: RHS repeat-associated core domain-containing protein [Candidatus Acidoferrum sp.]|jgi:RHS repeat-associated protein